MEYKKQKTAKSGRFSDLYFSDDDEELLKIKTIMLHFAGKYRFDFEEFVKGTMSLNK